MCLAFGHPTLRSINVQFGFLLLSGKKNNSNISVAGMERCEDGSFSWPGASAENTLPNPVVHDSVNSTQFSSKWNKCKFQCPICDKVSNEKRHIRTHTMSAHGMSLDALEAENGDCEVHTEYFFCQVHVSSMS